MPAIQRYKIHPERAIIHEVTGLNDDEGCWRSQSSMADSSTTTDWILDPIAGDCWAQRRLRSGIMDVSVASKLMKLLTLLGVVFISTLAIPELDGRYLHDRWTNPESDCGKLLDSMPATQQYKIHPSATFIHDGTRLNRIGCWQSQNLIKDSSTTTTPILDPITGECWARRQLPGGIKDVSVASELMKSLTLVGVVFIDTLAIPELDGRFLHDRWTNPESDCGRLLGSMPATQRYKIHLFATLIHDVTGLKRMRCWRSQNSIADYSTTTAPILYVIAEDHWARCQLCSSIKDVSVTSELRKSLTLVGVVFIGTLPIPEHDGRFLHDRWTNLESDCGRLSGSTPAMQRYKIHPSATFIHDVTGLNRVGYWRSLNSIADYSTTTAPILDLIAGYCWARRQLHGGIRYVLRRQFPVKL